MFYISLLLFVVLCSPYILSYVIFPSFRMGSIQRLNLYRNEAKRLRPLSSFRLFESSEQSKETTSENSLEDLIAVTERMEQEALDMLNSAASSREIEVFRVLYLGQKGKISGMMKEMKSLSKTDKPKFGAVVNKAVKSVEMAIADAFVQIEAKEYQLQLEADDLGNTMQIPGSGLFGAPNLKGTRHPINLVLDLTCRIFEEIGYEVIDGVDKSPEIENEFYNFEALGMPANHPARDMQDTFYIDTNHLGINQTLLLRTHTSSVQIREMEKRTPPFKIVAPGRVYRKDDVDATHFPAFHQVEILAIDEMGKLTLPHLLGTVKHFLQKMFGSDIELKYRASYFPFTEPSIEVDVFFRGKWLEVLGCGMVDPDVLEAVGYDSTKYAGFAAGFGIERFAMIMHNIQDIRYFWENNEEFLSQFPGTEYVAPGDVKPKEIETEEDIERFNLFQTQLFEPTDDEACNENNDEE